ncbi:ribosomal RNA small subunit methyltransferase A [Candidatus Thiomargarita nelsonii]|uniref:Ribosomal RNA small subunit methyltransferase A n=1 Tax=Candidatus Thiomargarita nelsonii TaxID=1003181 RepID=A0A0A6P257_9GAMM|nr:ribosomal RNA small subunit methyltransferase A [Candidatus Thiomargarita nelsonii]
MKIHRKRFGQHFLHDTQIIQDIVAAIAPHPQEHLVEIGPGKGALTLPLLESGCQLDVIELDRDLIEWLKKTAKNQNLRIYNADALKFDFKTLLIDKRRIVGNLPYNISTPLLFHLLNYASNIEEMTFMLQKEVVDRMIAVPCTHDYGRLSVMLQYYCQIEKLFDVSPAAFYPPPKVESSVVQLRPFLSPPVLVKNREHFAKIVALAFSQRRKMLRNTLKKVFDAKDIEAAGIDPMARAETLRLEDFARLADNYRDYI